MNGCELENSIRQAVRLLKTRGETDVQYHNTGEERSSAYTFEIAASDHETVRLALRENVILRVWERDRLVLDATRTHPGERGYGEMVRVDGHTYFVEKHVEGAWRKLLDDTYERAFMTPSSSRVSLAPPTGSCVSRTARDS